MMKDLPAPAAAAAAAKAERDIYRAARGAFTALAASQRHGRTCRLCGCTDDNACAHVGGRACSWVAADLCSVCANSIADLMLALGLGDAAAEAQLKIHLANEARRTGVPVPVLRRLAHAARARPAS